MQFSNLIKPKIISSSKTVLSNIHQWRKLKGPEFNVEYLFDPNNFANIQKNIALRKGVGNIELVYSLKEKLKESKNAETEKQFITELNKIPNQTHPEVADYEKPNLMRYFGEKKEFEQKPLEFTEIVKRLKLARTEHLGNVSGNRSYYLLGDLAELEKAIVNYTLNYLTRENFKIVSVPDILPREVIEWCGMNTKGNRSQVYSLDSTLHELDLCLSGTSEMALAGFLSNQTYQESELPIRLASVSRCFRAEVSNILEERGIYRVHEFTKVEMFVAAKPEQSDLELEKIRQLQENYFDSLGLHFQVLDMPPCELGASAYRKYDIEAWMPGRGIYGEVSSCSNCTDYQSRRLGIKSTSGTGDIFVHTLNGTACAIPRLLIALIESGQNANGTINIPDVLKKYMNGKSLINKQKQIPELRLIKHLE